MNKRKTWAIGVLVFLAVLIMATYFLYRTLLPLFLAFALAYAFRPIVDFLEKKQVPRALAVVILMFGLSAGFALLIITLVPLLINEFRDFVFQLPDIFSKSVEKVAGFGRRYGIHIPVERSEFLETIRGYLEGASVPSLSPAMKFTRSFFSGAVSTVITILRFLLMPVFFFFFLRDLPKIKKYVYDLIPLKYHSLAENKFRRIDGVLSGFLRGQLVVALILACVFSIGLSIIGIKFGLFIGILSGFLNVIPYLGQIIGVTLAISMVLIDFTGWGPLIAVIALFAITNYIENTFITPRIVGRKVGLSPVWSIFALIVGGQTAGIIGLMVAIPVAGVIKVILLDIVDLYKKSDFYEN